MRYIPWTEKEFDDLRKTCKTCHTSREATLRHNAKWKTQRSIDSIYSTMDRHGLRINDLLSPPEQAAEKVPERIQALIAFLKGKAVRTVSEACDALDMSPRRLRELVLRAKEQNYAVDMPSDNTLTLSLGAPAVDRLAVHRLPLEPVAGHVRIGVASDLHFASKMHRGECLADFVDLAMADFGVRTIMVPGDILAGINMYQGQLNELECWGFEAQLALADKGLPQRDGLTWHVIGGNHDESLMKAGGANVVKALAKMRPDVEEHGFYSALIDLAIPKSKQPIKIELFHPDQAGAYAITYHMQKAIEQIPGGMKPQVLLVGHEHQADNMPDYRGVSGFLCGCFEDQTLYLKRKHKQPAIGGWVMDFGLTAGGALRTLTTTWVRYFHSRRGALRGAASDVRLDHAVGLPGD